MRAAKASPGGPPTAPTAGVEIVLEGEPEAVERVLKWCREGTRWSSVDAVEVRDDEPEGLTGFTIR